MTVRVLTEQDVRLCLDPETALVAVDRALAAMHDNDADTPLRSEIRQDDEHILLLFMPGRIPSLGALGQKIVAEFPSNETRGLPVLTASMVLLDPMTGLTRALLGATHLTNVRTAALTATAVRRFGPRDRRIATLVGTGGLAATQVDALAHDPSIREVRVCGRRPERARAVVDQLSALPDGVDVRAVDDVESAVTGADVVVTATSARDPVVADEWIRTGALVCAMGSNAPDMQELPVSLVGRASRVVADTVAGTVDRAGDLVRPITAGVLARDAVEELPSAASGPPTAAGPTIFKSCGFAAADLAIAVSVLDVAEERGLGQVVELGQ